MKPFPLALSVALALTLTACYSQRRTNMLEGFPELSDQRSSVVDESGVSEADTLRRRQALIAAESEPEPVYRVNAGDKLRIVVYNHPDLSGDTVVTPDGSIGFVFLGQVKLAGLTLAEAAKKLEQGLDGYVKMPAVGVMPVDISSQTATIAGAVAQPGMYGISNGMRIADLFALAGGSSVREFDQQQLDAADFDHSYFVRDGKILCVDFRAAIERGDPVENLRLRRGDYVYVAVRSESMVCLVGHVKNPHKRLWDKNLGLIELLTTGGWVEETYWPYVIVIRGGVANPTMYKVDVDAIVTGRKPNVKLLSGDIVYVPNDNISEYNVFVRKLLPTAQLINMVITPISWYAR